MPIEDFNQEDRPDFKAGTSVNANVVDAASRNKPGSGKVAKFNGVTKYFEIFEQFLDKLSSTTFLKQPSIMKRIRDVLLMV